MPPQGDVGTLPAGTVRVGAVDQPGIDDHHVPGRHRHVHLVRMRGVRGIVRVLDGGKGRIVGVDDVVERVRPAVRAGDHPQAPVLPRRVREVQEERDLGDAAGTRDRMAPAPPVLVPEQGRPAGRLADDVPGREARVVETQSVEHRLEAGVGDERRERRVVGEGDEAPLGLPSGPVLRAGGPEGGRRECPHRLEERRGQHPRDVAVALLDEPAARRRRVPCRLVAVHSFPRCPPGCGRDGPPVPLPPDPRLSRFHDRVRIRADAVGRGSRSRHGTPSPVLRSARSPRRRAAGSLPRCLQALPGPASHRGKCLPDYARSSSQPRGFPGSRTCVLGPWASRRRCAIPRRGRWPKSRPVCAFAHSRGKSLATRAPSAIASPQPAPYAPSRA